MPKPLMQFSSNRRDFLRHAALASGAIAMGSQGAQSAEPPHAPHERPKISCEDDKQPVIPPSKIALIANEVETLTKLIQLAYFVWCTLATQDT